MPPTRQTGTFEMRELLSALVPRRAETPLYAHPSQVAKHRLLRGFFFLDEPVCLYCSRAEMGR